MVETTSLTIAFLISGVSLFLLSLSSDASIAGDFHHAFDNSFSISIFELTATLHWL